MCHPRECGDPGNLFFKREKNMTQLPNNFLKTMGFDIDNPKDQLQINQSVMEHTCNGRGFWPVVHVGGIPQVLRFLVSQSPDDQNQGHHFVGAPEYTDGPRWTPETGVVDLVPLHSLRVSDWPRVRLDRSVL